MPEHHGACFVDTSNKELVEPSSSHLRVGAFDGGSSQLVEFLAFVAGQAGTPLCNVLAIGALRGERIDVRIPASGPWHQGFSTLLREVIDRLQFRVAPIGKPVRGGMAVALVELPIELPSGYRAPTVAGNNIPLEVCDETSSESSDRGSQYAAGD
jgi:hypothetical protein